MLMIMVSLAGCETAPVIIDLEHDKPVIWADSFTTEADILATALYACGLHGRMPEPINETELDVLDRHILFACVERRPGSH